MPDSPTDLWMVSGDRAYWLADFGQVMASPLNGQGAPIWDQSVLVDLGVLVRPVQTLALAASVAFAQFAALEGGDSDD